jgi:hypothetical protein
MNAARCRGGDFGPRKPRPVRVHGGHGQHVGPEEQPDCGARGDPREEGATLVRKSTSEARRIAESL